MMRWYWLLLGVCLYQPSGGEIYTSLVQLENVLEAEGLLADHLEQYILHEERRLEDLKRLHNEYDAHSREALKDPEGHLANPLNAYYLIKRFTTDWDLHTTPLINDGKADEFFSNTSHLREFFPQYVDLQGTVKALIRLQETYALSVEDMAAGRIPGIADCQPLTVNESLEIGRVAYYEADYYHAIMWLNQTLKIIDKDGADDVIRAQVLDFLAFSVYKAGDVRMAVELTKEWLKYDPGNPRAITNLDGYSSEIADPMTRKYSLAEVNKRVLKGYEATREFSIYEKLCRGERIKPIPDESKLYCRYKRDHPYFILRPLKEEVMYFEPFVAVYYDLAVESEIEAIRRLAKARLHRSGIFDTDAGAEYRISKSAWLDDLEDPKIAQLSLKTEASTGLAISSADYLQVLNYGIGGQYEPHWDYSHHGEGGRAFDLFGNRISTSLFYLSDVVAGGATVFTELGLSVFPVKGSMLFWHNLYYNGEGNPRTKHAGCPVLTGTKWVCNKWIHARDQTFRMPCKTRREA